jgi:hypothetical protein
MAGIVKHELGKRTIATRYNTEGQKVRTMYCGATGGLTSGFMTEWYLHPDYGYYAIHMTSGVLPKGYAPQTIASGQYGDIVIEGYCPSAVTTETTNTNTAWATCTGYAIQCDSGLNASNTAAAPTGAQNAFGIFVGTSPDSSSTTYGWPVNIFIDNHMSYDTA